jgi:betaine reductase
VEQHGAEDMVVILGAPDGETAGIYAETVTLGDPTYAGPLAGVSLNLPVFHVLEPSIKTQVDPAVYEREVGIMEMALDFDEIQAAMATFRQDEA